MYNRNDIHPILKYLLSTWGIRHGILYGEIPTDLSSKNGYEGSEKVKYRCNMENTQQHCQNRKVYRGYE